VIFLKDRMRYGFKKLMNSLSLVDKDCIDLPEKQKLYNIQ